MLLQWLIGVAGVACILRVSRLLRDLWWRPRQINKALRAQGVRGPPFIPIVGNQPEVARLMAEAGSMPMNLSSNEIVPRVLPHYARWSRIYGETFVYTFGSEVRLMITDPELIKEILSNKFGHFPKVSPSALDRDMLGDGLVLAQGEKWAQERRILTPGFHLDKLKAMVETIADLTSKMLKDWEGRTVETKQPNGVEIEVLEEYQNLTADVIAHTAFGTSYEEGKTVFKLQYSQLQMVGEAGNSIQIPGLSILPTAKNLYRWKIRKAIEDNLRQIVEKRLQLESQNVEVQHNDLLGIMISAYKGQLRGIKKNLRMTIQDIVDECKTFFFTGHDTTASLLTWTTMLLALHPDWQERARAEVINVCGCTHPSSDMLNQLKLVGMVINEALRLYPVASMLTRCTDRDTKVGRHVVPRGTVLYLLLLVMMHNKQLWGEDANNFNPERFSQGISSASKHPMAFMPFSVGPRSCIGQVFALMEAKVVLCKLLQRFSFQLSPTYVHAPTPTVIVKPTHGVQILVKPINVTSS
ncbi:hypothetical protein O6H91_23G010800 [Diphasiastrum complanatum]|uniref:Uncharacterized protein n=1 Tax=Diphasiastrum complanatum TaxID=34168 RepID=A0ACC2A819_DIPCM|nr:hypothetical protein O6H91_Y188000 [Diphasiastrum complanatum]KAJ7513685.1 hypothetical protein O6H91_23G010800 [Diphasiastrum complanatum]